MLDAQNADETLAIIESDPQKIDVLYTDIDMPGSTNGLTLAQQVHQRMASYSARGDFGTRGTLGR